ncbi:alpha/beta fold hydrolase [Streptomyces sp. NPDC059009]|uniref:alpha/beta fold hydrolase n=1 Tax=Streptomyces sp. NPDC059009 TaxID=3346694 RepID=UPI00368DFCAA
MTAMTATYAGVTTGEFRTPDGVRLAYTDFGGAGRPVLALHGAYGRGRSFHALARHLGPGYRVIALDQRGHGHSDRPGDYSREAYLADTAAAIEHFGLAPAILIGHSLGGINAYQLAARRPELVEAVVIADSPVALAPGVVSADWLTGVPDRFPTFAELRAQIEAANSVGFLDHFTESAVEDERGWGFLWRRDDMAEVMRGVTGDWWADWAGSAQPFLFVRGATSRYVSPEDTAEMAARRPGTQFAAIEGAGHDFYLSHTAEFAAVTRRFLDALPPARPQAV